MISMPFGTPSACSKLRSSLSLPGHAKHTGLLLALGDYILANRAMAVAITTTLTPIPRRTKSRER